MRGNTKKNEPQVAETSALHPDDAYRHAAACMARTLVSDMFDLHQACSLRECRAGKRCLAYQSGGFCPVEMDSRQGCVLAGMMLFHDVLHQELFDPEPVTEDLEADLPTDAFSFP